MSAVTVSLVKSYSNISDYEDDELLYLFIDSAEQFLGNYIGRPLTEFNPVPADLKRAVLMLVAFYYEQREAVAFGITGQVAPFGVTSIANSYRERWFGEANEDEKHAV